MRGTRTSARKAATWEIGRVGNQAVGVRAADERVRPRANARIGCECRAPKEFVEVILDDGAIGRRDGLRWLEQDGVASGIYGDAHLACFQRDQ